MNNEYICTYIIYEFFPHSLLLLPSNDNQNLKVKNNKSCLPKKRFSSITTSVTASFKNVTISHLYQYEFILRTCYRSYGHMDGPKGNGAVSKLHLKQVLQMISGQRAVSELIAFSP